MIYVAFIGKRIFGIGLVTNKFQKYCNEANIPKFIIDFSTILILIVLAVWLYDAFINDSPQIVLYLVLIILGFIGYTIPYWFGNENYAFTKIPERKNNVS